MRPLIGTARFISDLHLQPGDDIVVARFFAFLEDCARAQIAELFILGDLFEAWIGDEALDEPLHAEVARHLRALADSGTQIHFQHGNRDFLLGARMAVACGMDLLPEVAEVGAGGTAILLMHGDMLCAGDVDYLRFRAMVRDPAWQANFLARPLADRQAEAARLRAGSRAAMAGKSEALMDVAPDAVHAALAATPCRTLIHGHTHRPACHALRIDGEAATRWVLSDWTADRADAIEVKGGRIQRLALA